LNSTPKPPIDVPLPGIKKTVVTPAASATRMKSFAGVIDERVDRSALTG